MAWSVTDLKKIYWSVIKETPQTLDQLSLR